MKILEKLMLVSEDLKTENSLNKERVKPVKDLKIYADGQNIKTVLKRASWNVIRLKNRTED